MFDSRHHPGTEGIIVPEVDQPAAERQARRMAALRPSADDQGGSIGGICHLVEIDGIGGITSDDIVGRWNKISPYTVATVGMSSETPMYVDLIKDGPHGLIGGTSGSGKTEFLKTMFMSLCLNNHPDDLSIVIVDFKGGVDHDAVRPLPHVVDVATNLDIEQFKRTIAMLNAEQKRRRTLLNQGGANNIVTYRQARESKPWLPPLPRLLVVVDEFSELLASDGGREQLKELESITRIGRALGLHLLLVTQNFEGNLPAQIEANAGLRISLACRSPRTRRRCSTRVSLRRSPTSVPDAHTRFHGARADRVPDGSGRRTAPRPRARVRRRRRARRAVLDARQRATRAQVRGRAQRGDRHVPPRRADPGGGSEDGLDGERRAVALEPARERQPPPAGADRRCDRGHSHRADGRARAATQGDGRAGRARPAGRRSSAGRRRPSPR
ncbi:MAG: FtsK/SpoIIIE domain-containing protein [Ilumatobacteraceae bacterium]